MKGLMRILLDMDGHHLLKNEKGVFMLFMRFGFCFNKYNVIWVLGI